MAKVQITGDAFSIETNLLMEDIQNLKKFNPQALKLKNEKGDEVFAITLGTVGSISDAGIVFTSAADNGNASVTAMFPETNMAYEDKRKFITNEVGKTILKLNEIEPIITTELRAFNEAIAEIESSIN